MKKLIKIFLAVCAAGAVQMAGAVNYHPSDLLLVFHQTGYNDAIFDIGSVSNFTGLAAGTIVSVSYDTNLVVTNFGTLSTANYAIVGGNDASAHLWLSSPTNLTTPFDFTPNNYATLFGKIDGAGTSAKAVTGGDAGPLVIDPTDSSSYSYIVSPGDPASVGSLGGDAPFSVSTAAPGQLALYQLIPTLTSPTPQAVKLGTFNLAANGTLKFTASAVTPVITASSGIASTAITTRGGSVTLSVTSEFGTSYQWFYNGVAIVGATNSTLTLTNVQPANIGNYSVKVSDSTYNSSVTSASRNVRVTQAYVAGDTLLVFHDGVNPDVVFNIGSISNLINQGVNSTAALNYNRAAVLANFGGSLTGVQVSLVAANDNVSTVWMSDANTSGAPTDVTPNTYATLESKIQSAGSTAGGIVGSLDFNNPLIIAPSELTSYSSIVSPGDPGNVASFGGDAPFTVGATISAGGTVSFRLYALQPAVGVIPAETFLGYLDIAAGGTNVNFATDNTSPTLTVTAPKALAKIGGTNNANNVMVTGTATDNRQLAAVEYSLNGAAFANATLVGTSWSVANLPFVIGSNSIAIKSVDVAGNESSVTNRALLYTAYSTLHLLSSGSGSVTPNDNGLNLIVGKAYTFTATPGAGYLPSNWVAVVNGTTNDISHSSKYSFVPQLNPTTLTVNFVANQLLTLAGSYNGLFSEANGATVDSAGFANIKVTAKDGKPAAFSAKLNVAGEKVSAAGTFYVDGNGSNTKPIVFKSNINTLTLNLHIPFDGSDTLTGTVSNNATHWSADLMGDRALTNTGYASTNTLVIPAPTNGPAGDGYATVLISGTGVASISGKLGDGQVIKQKVPVSKNGDWPFFAAANPNASKVYQGAVLGWFFVSNTPPAGSVTWVKNAGDTTYAAGFDSSITVLSSRYTNLAPALTLVNGTLTLTNGNLSGALTNLVALSALNKFTASTNYGLKLAITPTTGLLKGTFLNPDNGKLKTAITGVVLQNTGTGYGSFIGGGADAAGSFQLQSN